MTKLYLDAGTSWSKVLEIGDDKNAFEFAFKDSILNKIPNLGKYSHTEPQFQKQNERAFIFPSKLLRELAISFDGATGHMAKNMVKQGGNFQNEMLSLAYGAKKILSKNDLKKATIVDIGSRDIKWVRFINGKYKDLDWNGSCGSSTGATLEMLSRFYGIDPLKIPPQKEKIPVTCGVFAMEKIMDEIISDISPQVAVAKYIHGIAYNTWSFSGMPEKIFLSGGLCLNNCFVQSLKNYCETELLGRFVLARGVV